MSPADEFSIAPEQLTTSNNQVQALKVIVRNSRTFSFDSVLAQEWAPRYRLALPHMHTHAPTHQSTYRKVVKTAGLNFNAISI